MSNYLGVVVTGSVVPGVVDPNLRKSFVTNSFRGPPSKIQRVTDKKLPPLQMGDDKQPDFLHHIKKMLMSELAKPVTEAVPAMRDWR